MIDPSFCRCCAIGDNPTSEPFSVKPRIWMMSEAVYCPHSRSRRTRKTFSPFCRSTRTGRVDHDQRNTSVSAFTFCRNALPDSSRHASMSEIRSTGVKSPIPGSSAKSRYCQVVSARSLSAPRPL
jgi:hypothetical protein